MVKLKWRKKQTAENGQARLMNSICRWVLPKSGVPPAPRPPHSKTLARTREPFEYPRGFGLRWRSLRKTPLCETDRFAG